MTNEEAKALLEKYNRGMASPSEAALLQYWFIHEASRKESDMSEQELAQITMDMRKEVVKQTKPNGSRLWPRIAAAAAAVAIVFGVWFYTSRPVVNRNSEIANQNDIAPGTNKATLILADGKIINLSDEKSGVVIDASSLKYNDGSAVERGDSDLRQDVKVNTPRGGTYQVTLPDGTKIWLNAASSLKFPSTFVHLKNREVELTGEAYFEVAHNAEKSFRVKSKGQVIEVLGTKFNINAYIDEPATRTTLLEGAVKVSTSGMAAKNIEVRLKPGQQTTLQNNKLIASDANMEEAFAWKNGLFSLNNESLESIMRKLSRWYNIDVEYKGNIPERQFGGEISRNTNLSEVLETLKAAKVNCTVEGRKIIITP
jgi:transmembrane sensor